MKLGNKEITKNSKLFFNPLKYKSNYALIDIESFNDIGNAIPYDISIAIYNPKRKLVATYVLLYNEIFTNTAFKSSVYFKEKLPVYFNDFDNKAYKYIIFKVGSLYDMVNSLNDIIDQYDLKLMIGYNAHFDYTAINRLYQVVNDNIRIEKGWHKFLKKEFKSIPKLVHNNFRKLNYFDLWEAYTELLTYNKPLRLDYYTFCYQRGKLTESGKCISSNEDTLYKFLIDLEHEEAHQGFKDIEDEAVLYERLIQYLKRGKINTDKTTYLTLNTRVKATNFYSGGLYNLARVHKELKANGYIE